jgi:paraquat-inducible protein B
MELNELNNKNVASRALRENFAYNLNASSLNKSQTATMLRKVRGLINESRNSHNFHKNHANPTHMKLVFMEQALASHMNYLNSMPKPRIVFENEEVEKSQVILAAQDMIDSVQKMIEEVSDMLVKELPALSDSIESEIGPNESQQFNSQVSQALSNLNTALQETQTNLKGALNTITGKGDANFGLDMDNEMGADLDNDEDALDADMDMDMDVDSELPPIPNAAPPAEKPEKNVSGAGRPKR